MWLSEEQQTKIWRCGRSASPRLETRETRGTRVFVVQPQTTRSMLFAEALATRLQVSLKNCGVSARAPPQWAAVLGALLQAAEESWQLMHDGL